MVNLWEGFGVFATFRAEPWWHFIEEERLGLFSCSGIFLVFGGFCDREVFGSWEVWVLEGLGRWEVWIDELDSPLCETWEFGNMKIDSGVNESNCRSGV